MGKLRSSRTHGGNNLCLQAKLVLESTGKVADASLSITGHVWDLANVIEHVSAREEQHSDQADSSPQVAVLDDGQSVWSSDCDKADNTKDTGGYGNEFEPIEWSIDFRFWAIGKLAA